VNRLSIRDFTSAIIPAICAYAGRVLIAMDDMTGLTPTLQAFWLSVFEHTQVVACASERKSRPRKLWWRMKAIEVPALELVRYYIARHGMLIESPELYVGHVVKQAGGNPQAIFDMLNLRGADLLWPSPVRVDFPGNQSYRMEAGSKAGMVLFISLLFFSLLLYPASCGWGADSTIRWRTCSFTALPASPARSFDFTTPVPSIYTRHTQVFGRDAEHEHDI